MFETHCSNSSKYNGRSSKTQGTTRNTHCTVTTLFAQVTECLDHFYHKSFFNSSLVKFHELTQLTTFFWLIDFQIAIWIQIPIWIFRFQSESYSTDAVCCTLYMYSTTPIPHSNTSRRYTRFLLYTSITTNSIFPTLPTTFSNCTSMIETDSSWAPVPGIEPATSRLEVPNSSTRGTAYLPTSS